jgi:hypothetical protein
MSLRRVAPGLFVREDIKISTPHPDPCWVIQMGEDSLNVLETLDNGGYDILIFSSKVLIEEFQKTVGFSSDVVATLKTICYTWDELVDKFNGNHSNCLLDHRGEAGFYQSIPLQKNI